MTLKYESEILFDLMKRDGFNVPSSVPPYESEIKAYFIDQVKQGYPKLTDYEAEWLLYNYTNRGNHARQYIISDNTTIIRSNSSS